MKRYFFGILYALWLGCFIAEVCLFPSRALSAVFYTRTANQSQVASHLTAVTGAAGVVTDYLVSKSATGGDIVIRHVTSGPGWASIGVALGLIIYSLYYTSGDTQQLRLDAAPPGPLSLGGNQIVTTSFCGSKLSGGVVVAPDVPCSVSVSGSVHPLVFPNWPQVDGAVVVELGRFPGGSVDDIGCGYQVFVGGTPSGKDVNGFFSAGSLVVGSMPLGSSPPTPWWTGWSGDYPTWYHVHGNGSCHVLYVHSSRDSYPSSTHMVNGSVLTATDQNVRDYLSTQAGRDKYFGSSHSYLVGQTKVEPAGAAVATNVMTLPVLSSDIATQVVPETSVSSTDSVLAQGLPAPQSTTQTSVSTSTSVTNPDGSTTATTTTTNPDGSTTATTTTTPAGQPSPQPDVPDSVSCGTGRHDGRTAGSVLTSHVQVWQSGPLAQSLTALKNISWPTSLPVVSFSSSIFGSFVMDLNAWAWVFVAVRTVMIGGAALVSYRLVFG